VRSGFLLSLTNAARVCAEDHAETNNRSATMIQPNLIAL
jgi:hypothetical protein